MALADEELALLEHRGGDALEELEVAPPSLQLPLLREERGAPHPEVVVARPPGERRERLRVRRHHRADDVRREPVDVRPAPAAAHQLDEPRRVPSAQLLHLSLEHHQADGPDVEPRAPRQVVHDLAGARRRRGPVGAQQVPRAASRTSADGTPWKESALFMYAFCHCASSALPAARKRARSARSASLAVHRRELRRGGGPSAPSLARPADALGALAGHARGAARRAEHRAHETHTLGEMHVRGSAVVDAGHVWPGQHSLAVAAARPARVEGPAVER